MSNPRSGVDRTRYNQVKYRSSKLTNNPKQGLDRIYHWAKTQDPMWFDSGMRVQKPEFVKRMNEHVMLAKTSPTTLWAWRGTNRNLSILSNKYIPPVWEQKMSIWRSLILYDKTLLRPWSFKRAPSKKILLVHWADKY